MTTKKINPDEFEYVKWVGTKQPQKVHSPTGIMKQYTTLGKDHNSYGFSNQNRDGVLYVHKKDIKTRPYWFKSLTKTEETNFKKYGTLNPSEEPIEKETKEKTVDEKETKQRGRKPSAKKV